MLDINAKPWKKHAHQIVNKYANSLIGVDVPASDVAGTMQKKIFKINAAAITRIECIGYTCKKYTICNTQGQKQQQKTHHQTKK